MRISQCGLVLLIACGCSHAPEARFFNFDRESMPPGALVEGWGPPMWESDLQGNTYVWAVNRNAVLEFDGRFDDDDRLIRFRGNPFSYPGNPQRQAIELSLNDTPLKTVTTQDDLGVYSVIAPREAWRRGRNRLRFAFRYAEAPANKVPGNADQRTLAFRFDWLEIEPPMPQP
jgi:hypothetical protein